MKFIELSSSEDVLFMLNTAHIESFSASNSGEGTYFKLPDNKSAYAKNSYEDVKKLINN